MIGPNTPKGTRIKVCFKGVWYKGVVVENVNDNERCIVVKTDEKVHDKPFLNGRGLSVGYRSDGISYS